MKTKSLYIRVDEDFLERMKASLVEFNSINGLSLNISQYTRLLIERGAGNSQKSLYRSTVKIGNIEFDKADLESRLRSLRPIE